MKTWLLIGISFLLATPRRWRSSRKKLPSFSLKNHVSTLFSFKTHTCLRVGSMQRVTILSNVFKCQASSHRYQLAIIHNYHCHFIIKRYFITGQLFFYQNFQKNIKSFITLVVEQLCRAVGRVYLLNLRNICLRALHFLERAIMHEINTEL